MVTFGGETKTREISKPQDTIVSVQVRVYACPTLFYSVDDFEDLNIDVKLDSRKSRFRAGELCIV